MVKSRCHVLSRVSIRYHVPGDLGMTFLSVRHVVALCPNECTYVQTLSAPGRANIAVFVPVGVTKILTFSVKNIYVREIKLQSLTFVNTAITVANGTEGVLSTIVANGSERVKDN